MGVGCTYCGTGCGFGLRFGLRVSPFKSKETREKKIRKSKAISKISTALMQKKLDHANDPHPMTFERILLKFDKMHALLKEIRTVFLELENGQSGLNLDGLQRAMVRLNIRMTGPEIVDMFDFIDVDSSKSIDLKEFLVALTIGMVLEATKESLQRVNSNSSRISLANFHGKKEEVKEMLNLFVSAYLLFDKEGEGVIYKTGIQNMISEHKTKGHTNMMLSKQRWEEMNWDENGTIDFPEFVLAFSTWVDIEEDMEEEDEAALPPPQR